MSAATPAGPLTGRNVMITGAGAGIGRALSLACAAAGAQLLLLSRSQQHLESTCDAITTAGGAPPVLIPGDLNRLDDAAAEQIGEAVQDQFGALHGLVHSAAVLGARVPLAFYGTADWQTVLQVNLTAPFLLTRALLPALQAAAAARVLFMSAAEGVRGSAYWGAYAASKFGIEGLAQVWREELEATTRIGIHVIDPGRRRTGLRAAAFRAEDPAAIPPADEDLDIYLHLLAAPADAELPARALARDWRAGNPR